KGAIVIMQEPRPLSPPKPVDRNAEIYHPQEEPPAPAGLPAAPGPYEKYLANMQAQMKFLVEEGAVAVLRDSNKPRGLLTMTSGTTVPFELGPLPLAFV